MMDALAIEAAEAAVSCRYPEGAGAVLIVELDGPAADVAAQTAAVREICTATGRLRDQGGAERRRARRDLDRP